MAMKSISLLGSRDVIPMANALVAARLLQEAAVSSKRHERALRRMGRIAEHNFISQELPLERLAEIEKAYQGSAYWHGTGRYQRVGSSVTDTLQAIFAAGAIRPSLDRFDPRSGTRPVMSLSLATTRLYARCYADMHHENPGELNRFMDAQHAVAFFVMRPYMRHILLEARQHPSGLRAGYRDIQQESLVRQSQMPQVWTHKIGEHPVNPMFAFRSGSDIPGNYGVIFGIREGVTTLDVHPVFAESREVRSGQPISLDQVTHVEVPREHVLETEGVLSAHGSSLPVFATEDFEAYTSGLPIEQVFGLPTTNQRHVSV